jgi:hypothetical protein
MPFLTSLSCTPPITIFSIAVTNIAARRHGRTDGLFAHSYRCFAVPKHFPRRQRGRCCLVPFVLSTHITRRSAWLETLE